MEADAETGRDDLRLDVEILRTMIDHALDSGAGGDDLVLRACADVLHERRTRLTETEHAVRWIAEMEAYDDLDEANSAG